MNGQIKVGIKQYALINEADGEPTLLLACSIRDVSNKSQVGRIADEIVECIGDIKISSNDDEDDGYNELVNSSEDNARHRYRNLMKTYVDLKTGNIIAAAKSIDEFGGGKGWINFYKNGHELEYISDEEFENNYREVKFNA